jgi:hypothetical protein
MPRKKQVAGKIVRWCFCGLCGPVASLGVGFGCPRGEMEGNLRQTMRKVANDPLLKAIVM